MTRNPARIQVLCVDDHPLVRQGIATLLSVEPDLELVGEGGNGREAVDLFRRHRPDVTLMDLLMPGMSGLDAIGAILAEFPGARILVLTTYSADVEVQRALQAGAIGVLLKSALHKELLAAVRAVHAGGRVLPSGESLELAGHVADETLSPTEMAVLRLVAQGRSHAEIAGALAIGEGVVEEQVRRIVAKLGELDRMLAPGARASNRAKSELLASMSHELRTPLNAVLGYAQLLVLEGGLNERQARGLDTIRRSGQHLLSLVNDILDLARLEAGHARPTLAPTDLQDLLEQVTDLLRVQADEKQLACLLALEPGLPAALMADERRLRQVLLNLLGNAIKFTDSGSVTLRAGCEPAGDDRVRLRLAVEDTGIGIRPDELPRIFEPFVQVGDARRRAGGTGLGLAITRALVSEMGGQVEVDSEPGRGTRFRVMLPLALA